MRPRKVKGLDPQGTLADNAQRIVGVRLDELCAFVPAVLDPGAVRELHDMRIAAKRLRYVLEVTAEPCFGPYAKAAAKRAKELQDLLGEIHDCDVQLPRVEALVTELRDADAHELRLRAGDADDLDPALAAKLPHGDAWRGLVALETYLRARRELLYDRFTSFWLDLEREGFRPRLEYAIAERPAPEPAPHAAEPEPPAAEPGPPEPVVAPTEAAPAVPPLPLPHTMASGSPEAPVGPAVPEPEPPPAPPPAEHPVHHAAHGIHPTIPIGSPEAPVGPPAPDPDEAPEDREPQGTGPA
jgi:hypothetical protein